MKIINEPIKTKEVRHIKSTYYPNNNHSKMIDWMVEFLSPKNPYKNV